MVTKVLPRHLSGLPITPFSNTARGGPPWRPLLPQMEMEVRALGQNRKACVLRGRRLTGAPAREPVVHTRSASSVRHDANQEDWRRKSPVLDPLLSQNQGALDPFAFD